MKVENPAIEDTREVEKTAHEDSDCWCGVNHKASDTSTTLLENYARENLNIHTRGLLRRKIPVMDMLSWTQEAIRKPLIITVEKNLKNSAVDMFRLVKIYMGDRKLQSGMTMNSVALDIISMAYNFPSLRDELFVQLCKQTTDNQRFTSLCRGWELMALALVFFPPSDRLSDLLSSYIDRHTDPTYTSLCPEGGYHSGGVSQRRVITAHYAGVSQRRLKVSMSRPL